MSILVQALEQTADWFKRALAVEPVKGNLRLSGYSACGQDGGVQLPHEYVEGISQQHCELVLFFCSTIFNRNDFITWFIDTLPCVDGVAEADLVLLVTTRPTTGNTLAWAVACERDQWGRAIAGIFPSRTVLATNFMFCSSNFDFKFLHLHVGHVNVAPHHLIAEAEHCFQLI